MLGYIGFRVTNICLSARIHQTINKSLNFSSTNGPFLNSFDVQSRKGPKLILKVSKNLGDNVLRTKSTQETEGHIRGQEDTGDPMIPIGSETLERNTNVVGEQIDERGQFGRKTFYGQKRSYAKEIQKIPSIHNWTSFIVLILTNFGLFVGLFITFAYYASGNLNKISKELESLKKEGIVMKMELESKIELLGVKYELKKSWW